MDNIQNSDNNLKKIKKGRAKKDISVITKKISDNNFIDSISNNEIESIPNNETEHICNNEIESICTNETEYEYQNEINELDNDNIRQPDKIIKEKLIDIDQNELIINENDDDITKAIKISKLEYYYKNNLIKNQYNNKFNFQYNYTEDIDRNIIDESIEDNKSIINEDIENAIELSKKELEEEYNNMEMLIKIESEKIEREKRIRSLETFCKKIRTLNYTKNDIEIKNFVELVLDDYFNLKIDYIIIEDELMYNNLYEIIDSYYKIPIIKNFKKTAISEYENNVIRSIFRGN